LRVVMKVMIKPQGQIDHEGDFGDDLGAAAETGDEVTNVAVVLLDGESQVFAGEELILRNEAVKPFPIVGQEDFALDANFIEELLTEPAPAKAGVASSRPPSTQAMVRRRTASYARQIHSFSVFF
jgi:hypothetical protein